MTPPRSARATTGCHPRYYPLAEEHFMVKPRPTTLRASYARALLRAGKLLVLLIPLGLCESSVWGQVVSVLTYHNDNARTGQNTNETVLTPANVRTGSFGRLFSYAVDGQVYAQPLYVPGLAIPGQGTHNVVFVATQHDSVYAFDADSNMGPNGGMLWHISLGTSAATPNNDFGNRYGPYHDIDPEVGITGTPVIDPASGTIYVDAFTHEGTAYFHRIHALNITNGLEQSYSPVTVSASVAGIGVGSKNGVLSFNPQSLQRPALTLAGGILFVAYSGFADTDPYHGWVIGFQARNLQQLTNYVFNTTPNATTATDGPNAGEGGLWMSGNGLSADSNNNLYLEVGNGSFNANVAGGTEYGDSFVKLSTSSRLAVADYFTPFNQASLSAGDQDLGSGGPLVLPDSVGSAAHPHLIVGCGKEGKIYLLDRDNLGHYNSVSDSQIIQEIANAVPGGTWSSAAYFNNLIFYHGSGDVLRSFKITNGLLGTSPASQSTTSFGFPGATPSISANGTNNAIAWVIQSDGYPGGAAVLHAYNAYNLGQELYNSSMAGAKDVPGGAIKFTVPTIANGKVYVGAQSALSVFGSGTFISGPNISPAGEVFTNSVTVTLSDTTSGVTLYYTVDNSTPTTNSAVYSTPIVLTKTAAIKVFAFKPGLVPSTVVSATFINSASLRLSAGFVKQEFYSGAVRANLENPSFSTPPTFIHYQSSFETPSGQGVNYAERVSGYFIPAQSGSYVFFVCSDDDSDLFLSTDNTPAHKHLIAQETTWSNSREWLSSGGGSVVASKRSDQFAGTTWPTGNTINLNAGTSYYLEADHHQGGGGDDFSATFKLSTAADPTNGTAPRLTGNLIAGYTFDNAYIIVTTQPTNTFAPPGSTATFSARAVSGYLGDTSSGQGPLILYQWQAAPPGFGSFTNIPNATGSSYTIPRLTAQQNGMQFQVVLTSAAVTTASSVAVLTVPAPAQLLVKPASLNFGLVVVGKTNTQNFQVVNTGGQTLNGSGITGLPFTLMTGIPFSVPPGQTGQVSVAFTPTSASSFSNVVLFTSNGGSSTNPLLGSGIAVPMPSFVGNPTNGFAPLTVSFTDNSTGTITNRFWDWGDGIATNTTATSLVHVYNSLGTNTVRLTVSGPAGTSTVTNLNYIVVSNLPPVTLTIRTLTNQAQLVWTLGTLQSASQIGGLYTNLTTTSPYTLTPTSAAQFFRVKVR